MKNWKIKKMSYQQLIDQNKAVGSLLYYYRKGTSYPDECPLCEVAKKYLQSHSTADCWNCLWAIMENMTCGDFVNEEIGINYGIVSATNLQEWHELRIPMLRRWRKRLKAEMNSRTEGGG